MTLISSYVPDTIVEEIVDFEAAIVAIKRKARGRTVFLGVSQFAPSNSQEGALADHTRGRIVYSHVKVNLGQALAYLHDAYSVNMRDKYSVRIAYSKNCLFIGSSC